MNAHEQAVEAAKRCPHCGYTDEDKLIHGDHSLCDQRQQKPALSPRPPVDAEWCREFVDAIYEAGYNGASGSTAKSVDRVKAAYTAELTDLLAGRDGWRPIAEAESLKVIDGDDYLFCEKHEDVGDWICIGHWAVSLGRWEFDGERDWSEGLAFNPTLFQPLPGIPLETR